MDIKLLLLCSLAVFVNSQENAQTRIPEYLLECYQDHWLLQRESRLPMTMSMLIDLIKKVENDPAAANMDMRVLVIGLIQRFRLDGVVKSSKITASNNVVPFSPLGFQFYKHKILLSKLIPGNPIKLANETLTPIEKCTLHHMMSSTVETESRGDEGTVCNKLSQYRTQRLPRSAMNKKGNMKMSYGDRTDVDVDINPGVYNTGSETPMSQCPVEDGVVQTLWGSVAVGPVLSGIAAGLQPQKVTISELSSGAKDKIQYSGPVVVDNKFAATLAGDLAESALRQGPISQSKIALGAGGGWNNTQSPKWYFLSQSTNYEMTDAEIRGGIDGLILASNMNALMSKTSSLKLSQVLDMYYSQRGLFSDKLKACNRKALMTEVAPQETLLNQVFGFSIVLDQDMNLEGTIVQTGFKDYATNAVSSLSDYIPTSLNDLSCSATATLPINLDVEASSDIYIYLDAQWTYRDINPALSYLLENINVSPYGTNITMFNAKDGDLIINSTSSISAFQRMYNESVHQQIPPGLNLPKIFQSIRQLNMDKLNNETALKWGGGKSTIALIITGTSTFGDSDITYAIEQLRILYTEVPDLKFLYLVSGSTDRFTQLVIDSKKDIIPLSVGNNENTANQMNALIRRIKEVPRRLINRLCGADFKANTTGNTVVIDNVAPGGINYYRLPANYFFANNEKTVVKIKGGGFGTMNICYSRIVELPRFSNSTGINSEGVTCQSITSNTIEIPLKDACSSRSYIYKCEPYYISLEVVASGDTSQNLKCFDSSCKTPDAVQFTITMDELGCFSSGSQLVFNSFLILSSMSILLKTYVF